MDKERDKCLECGLVIRAKERNGAEKALSGAGGGVSLDGQQRPP